MISFKRSLKCIKVNFTVLEEGILPKQDLIKYSVFGAYKLNRNP